MTAKLEVTGLETLGDQVRVTAQGTLKGSADWRPMERWIFTVPIHLAKGYFVGKILRAKVTS